ncbi:OB-fold nucleic acid binding domain-containing protein [Mycoplasmopsis cynos]|nr:OB-fold nucleic acid binding domain-containing protein [Mycoplasmopsis cynos]
MSSKQKRKFGEINFVDLRDKHCITQLVFNEPINFSKESVLEVRGTVKERKDKNYETVYWWNWSICSTI